MTETKQMNKVAETKAEEMKESKRREMTVLGSEEF